MVNMVEKANSMYNRNYLSVVKDKGKNGDILVFKGDGEMTMLESEFEYHVAREASSRRFEKDVKFEKDIKFKDFSIPTPKLGRVSIKQKNDYATFAETTIEKVIQYARKQEFDYVYKNNEVSGKAILMEMVQQGSMKMNKYLAILPALENLTDNVEIILE